MVVGWLPNNVTPNRFGRLFVQVPYEGFTVREIAGLNFTHDRWDVLVSLKFYLDGAGKEDANPVITVAGFYAESGLCDQIEKDWLQATGGKPFHFTDFGQPSCQLGSAAWPSGERIAFLKRLAGIVNRSNCNVTSVSLEVAEFNKTLGNLEHPQEIGPAFSACAYASVAFAESRFMNQGTQRQRIDYVFEKGDRQHELVKVFGDWDEKNSKLSGLRGISFYPKQTALLEPADLIAGVVQRCALRGFKALSTLDNGLARTQLNTFERYYSGDGVTAAIVSGHDTDKCWIANAKNFKFLDGVSKEFFQRHPEQLPKRRKRLPFRPTAKATK